MESTLELAEPFVLVGLPVFLTGSDAVVAVVATVVVAVVVTEVPSDVVVEEGFFHLAVLAGEPGLFLFLYLLAPTNILKSHIIKNQEIERMSSQMVCTAVGNIGCCW